MATILILEDDAGAAFELSDMLENNGHDTVWCRNAHEAFATYDRDTFGVVIADVFVRNNDKVEPEGLKFIAKTALRERHDPNRTPIIAISGAGHAEYNPYVLSNARSAGAAFALEKPIDEETLLKTVAKALSATENSD